MQSKQVYHLKNETHKNFETVGPAWLIQFLQDKSKPEKDMPAAKDAAKRISVLKEEIKIKIMKQRYLETVQALYLSKSMKKTSFFQKLMADFPESLSSEFYYMFLNTILDETDQALENQPDAAPISNEIEEKSEEIKKKRKFLETLSSSATKINNPFTRKLLTFFQVNFDDDREDADKIANMENYAQYQLEDLMARSGQGSFFQHFDNTSLSKRSLFDVNHNENLKLANKEEEMPKTNTLELFNDENFLKKPREPFEEDLLSASNLFSPPKKKRKFCECEAGQEKDQIELQRVCEEFLWNGCCSNGVSCPFYHWIEVPKWSTVFPMTENFFSSSIVAKMNKNLPLKTNFSKITQNLQQNSEIGIEFFENFKKFEENKNYKLQNLEIFSNSELLNDPSFIKASKLRGISKETIISCFGQPDSQKISPNLKEVVESLQDSLFFTSFNESFSRIPIFWRKKLTILDKTPQDIEFFIIPSPKDSYFAQLDQIFDQKHEDFLTNWEIFVKHSQNFENSLKFLCYFMEINSNNKISFEKSNFDNDFEFLGIPDSTSISKWKSILGEETQNKALQTFLFEAETGDETLPKKEIGLFEMIPFKNEKEFENWKIRSENNQIERQNENAQKSISKFSTEIGTSSIQESDLASKIGNKDQIKDEFSSSSDDDDDSEDDEFN